MSDFGIRSCASLHIPYSRSSLCRTHLTVVGLQLLECLKNAC
jgi:hypothetical protein